MKTFELKMKNGEAINKIAASNVDEATEMFAEIKQLSTDSLLELFLIDEAKGK